MRRDLSHSGVALVAALAFSLVGACGEEATWSPPRTGGGPPGATGSVQPVIHTIDGRHLAFPPGDFRPGDIEHCREGGERRITSIFDLARVTPRGKTAPLCPDLRGRVQALRLEFPDRPAVKVTTMCEDGCVTPGGYYPPLDRTVVVPWSEIAAVELRRR